MSASAESKRAHLEARERYYDDCYHDNTKGVANGKLVVYDDDVVDGVGCMSEFLQGWLVAAIFPGVFAKKPAPRRQSSITNLRRNLSNASFFEQQWHIPAHPG